MEVGPGGCDVCACVQCDFGWWSELNCFSCFLWSLFWLLFSCTARARINDEHNKTGKF